MTYDDRTSDLIYLLEPWKQAWLITSSYGGSKKVAIYKDMKPTQKSAIYATLL